ncbi:hypothetical protein E5082_29430 [Streptomyces griseoluteus]|uniref:Uncharacterized protein n=1 Tax=Streptomyces griseoluteus TaxID=29306 RepID=A0A4Z1D0W1_STRGP|nr:hypothetical protein [Streptomyces griseoluteus]TGN75056.1 hypothetical protein E5082_29430 [Streptomyces griseoluteus]GHF34818.1 hypothetical protein GCM10017776_61630 [Streptomyces griseoluteus]
MDYLRRNERRFFRSGAYDAVELAGMIAAEALVLGAQNVRVQCEGDWLVVVADRDWLEPYGQEVFHSLTPLPEAGVNSVLAEVLAVAYSAGVATATSVGTEVIKGGTTPPLRLSGQDSVRAFAFRRRRE